MSAPATAPRREDLPDGSVRIWFAAPILHHADPKGSLLLRQPSVGELWEIGDPVTWVFDAENRGTPIVERDILLLWIKKLISEHDHDVIARDRDLALGMLIEETVLGFFRNARTALRPKSAS